MLFKMNKAQDIEPMDKDLKCSHTRSRCSLKSAKAKMLMDHLASLVFFVANFANFA